jgi:hypothetical protein
MAQGAYYLIFAPEAFGPAGALPKALTAFYRACCWAA